ncbi:hypothetical protein UAW_00448 [Enterococcus haemoperoxidus ATCC BAA-382]|uniref:Flavodoxin-like domain-containing protein n=1 Tax=Enterococcus haemoperoxidus ATCC BAA-382 TaxID=1158608 RepID=R2QV92_9ENTE|nr:hypothetical protein [Enterococcus haemoperoxidus]EOH99298.1 hypothetical protein UAW_00448 [Enterococcus haemoperoxidus ATCC BAA-382]EOT62961.1 hypothetical protein I583_01964 [Enterococcus haemoperoxidus ATCC BAA-382]OJG54681.1 hypothetical protein RV06_GL002640 [Enterococcus haemoperoxidus]
MKKLWKNKMFKYGLIGIVLIALGGAGFLGYYRIARIQGVTSSYEINKELKKKSDSYKAIIYTQDRAFKNEVINELKKNLVDENIYIQVESVEEIGENEIEDWDKVIVLSTVQSSDPPKTVLDYLNKHKNEEKLSIYLTADSGAWSKDPGHLDVTTAASNSENVTVFSRKITEALLN